MSIHADDARRSGDTPESRDWEATATLLRMLSGAWVNQIIRTAVELRIPDHLATGPATADDIATRESSNPDTTYRLLRACASLGLVAYADEGRFAANELSTLLRRDAGNGMFEQALMWGARAHWSLWEYLPVAVRQGRTQVTEALGMDFFTYMSGHPEERELFSGAMSGMARQVNIDLIGAIDATGVSVAVDVGGGDGSLVRGLMREHHDLRGVSLDLPGATADTRAAAERDNLLDRFTAVSGNFFESVPAGDLYLLKNILHNWDDEDCVRILRNCRASARPGARAVVVESVISEVGAPELGPLRDMLMLIVLPGKERDLNELDALFSASGWVRRRMSPTIFEFNILELQAV
jgi:hypothetical protein